MSTKVSLRKKEISGNRQSLYLDFYPPILHPTTGKLTRREFLKIYIISKPKNPLDKEKNKETLRLAEQLRYNKENNLNKPEIYSILEKEKLKRGEIEKTNFIEYFKKCSDKRSGTTRETWLLTYKYLKQFTKGEYLAFEDVTEKFCNSFQEYLFTIPNYRDKNTTISKNTVRNYFSKFKAVLKKAFKEDYLLVDINNRINNIQPEETEREFLTIEELNILIKTPCDNDLLKRAALFSALTGLRFSDIQKLKWNDVQYIENDGYYIRFRQQKTKGSEFLPISEQAHQLMEKSDNLENSVFEGLKYNAHRLSALSNWIKNAKITKKITFHCFRHTYATTQLSSGTDVMTISKMLGHREVKTTQIYAKIIDEKKREATNKIKLDF